MAGLRQADHNPGTQSRALTWEAQVQEIEPSPVGSQLQQQEPGSERSDLCGIWVWRALASPLPLCLASPRIRFIFLNCLFIFLAHFSLSFSLGAGSAAL